MGALERTMTTHVSLSDLTLAAYASDAALKNLVPFDGLDASDMQNQITIRDADPLRASLGFYEVTINGKTELMDRQGIEESIWRLRQAAVASGQLSSFADAVRGNPGHTIDPGEPRGTRVNRGSVREVGHHATGWNLAANRKL
jgi:hypothetical protein